MDRDSHDARRTDGGRGPDERRARVRVRTVLLVSLAIAVVLLALDNTEDVDVGYVVGGARVPLVWVILVSLASGAVLERLGTWFARRRLRRD